MQLRAATAASAGVMMHRQSISPAAVDRELLSMALVGWLLLVAGAVLLGLTLKGYLAGIFLLYSNLIWAFAWYQAWQRRALNHGDDAVPRSQLGWANRLTLLRGVLIAASAGFLFQNPVPTLAWVPALCYGCAVLLDRLDGEVARRSGQTSRLGSELDTVFDALGLLVAPLLAVDYGKVHWTYLLVSAAYYLFAEGLYWRRRHTLPVYPLHPSSLRRTLAGCQMGFVALALWPQFTAELTRLAGVAFMLPMLAGFTLDWLVVSGRLRPGQFPAAVLFGRLAVFSALVLQPALRLTLAAVLLWLALGDRLLEAEPLVGYGLLACALLVVAGLAARLSAAAALILLSSGLTAEQLDGLSGFAVFCAVFILLLGAGRFSLWQRDDDWIARPDGR